MRYLLTIIILLFITASCQKKDDSRKLILHYKVDINGKTEIFQACGTSDYVSEFQQDTAMFVAISCHGQSAGFHLKGKIVDGTYELNDSNQAFYRPTSSLLYKTNDTNKGILTISTKTDDRGMVMLVGAFEFKGIDTTSGKILIFNKGSFLMKKLFY